MSSLLKIQELFPSLTSSEQKIANYILQHKEDVRDWSVQYLAQKIKVSTATLVRFSHKIGYQGFPDLKLAIAKETHQQELPDLTEELTDTDTIEDLIQKSYNYRLHTLEKVTKLLDTQELKNAIISIQNARRIFLMGIGGSAIVCSDLYHKLTRIGYAVVYTLDTHVQLATLNGVSKEDVLICVSYSGETKEILLAGKIAQEKGVTVIAITQIVKNNLSRLADIVCGIPNEEKTFRIGAISSRDTSLFVADLLYMGVVVQQFDDVKRRLHETKKILNHLM